MKPCRRGFIFCSLVPSLKLSGWALLDLNLLKLLALRQAKEVILQSPSILPIMFSSIPAYKASLAGQQGEVALGLNRLIISTCKLIMQSIFIDFLLSFPCCATSQLRTLKCPLCLSTFYGILGLTPVAAQFFSLSQKSCFLRQRLEIS